MTPLSPDLGTSKPVAVMFVCLGNICRSTMAEGVFQSVARRAPYKELDIRISSSGTAGYHVGEPPDERTMTTLRAHGITDYKHSGRRLESVDLDEFDYVFAMDRDNLRNVQRLQQTNPGSKAKVMLFGEYSGTGKAEVVNDPYYGGNAGFERVYEQVERFSKNFLRHVFPDVGVDVGVGADSGGRPGAGAS